LYKPYFAVRNSGPVDKRIVKYGYFLLYHYGGVYSDLDIGCNNQSIRRILASIEENQGVSVIEVKPYGFSLEVLIYIISPSQLCHDPPW
jgi:hypothetical protein